MSYILDALKKSEAQRDPEAATTLAFNELQVSRQRNGLWLVVAALIVNAGVLVWFFWPDEQSNPPNSIATAPAAQADETELTSYSSKQPDVDKSAASSQTQDPQSQQPEQKAKQPTRLNSLPAHIRRDFPELVFSTHVYAEEPDLRAVVTNGKRMIEGEQLGELELQEITEEGVVFKFRQRLISVSVLDQWDAT